MSNHEAIPHTPAFKATESASAYSNFDEREYKDRLLIMNLEDKTIANSIERALPQIEALAKKSAEQLKNGHRMFYIGAGTSGRLGVLDASELPPTYGVPEGLVVGIIAGGDKALRKAIEGAEDDTEQGWIDLQARGVKKDDIVLGITASGSTPYVLGALQKCRENEIITACITCNANSPVEAFSDYPVVSVVGAEVIAGSTRMKAGTATKMILNMVSTDVMVSLGRVQGNRMIHMKPTNDKLRDRGARMIMEKQNISYEEAQNLLKQHGSVEKVLNIPKN